MAHELGDEGEQTAAGGPGGASTAAGRATARRAYARPVLTEFGTVHELTRGGTGAVGDAGKQRNPGKGKG